MPLPRPKLFRKKRKRKQRPSLLGRVFFSFFNLFTFCCQSKEGSKKTRRNDKQKPSCSRQEDSTEEYDRIAIVEQPVKDKQSSAEPNSQSRRFGTNKRKNEFRKSYPENISVDNTRSTEKSDKGIVGIDSSLNTTKKNTRKKVEMMRKKTDEESSTERSESTSWLTGSQKREWRDIEDENDHDKIQYPKIALPIETFNMEEFSRISITSSSFSESTMEKVRKDMETIVDEDDYDEVRYSKTPSSTKTWNVEEFSNESIITSSSFSESVENISKDMNTKTGDEINKEKQHEKAAPTDDKTRKVSEANHVEKNSSVMSRKDTVVEATKSLKKQSDIDDMLDELLVETEGIAIHKGKKTGKRRSNVNKNYLPKETNNVTKPFKSKTNTEHFLVRKDQNSVKVNGRFDELHEESREIVKPVKNKTRNKTSDRLKEKAKTVPETIKSNSTNGNLDILVKDAEAKTKPIKYKVTNEEFYRLQKEDMVPVERVKYRAKNEVMKARQQNIIDRELDELLDETKDATESFQVRFKSKTLNKLVKEAKVVAEPDKSKATDEALDTLVKEPKGVPGPDKSKVTEEELDTLLKEAKAIAEPDNSKATDEELVTPLKEAKADTEPNKSKVTDEELDTLLKEAKAITESDNSKATDEALDILLKEAEGVPEPDTSKAIDEELDTLLKEAKAVAEPDNSKARDEELDTLSKEAKAVSEPDNSKATDEELVTPLKEAKADTEPNKSKATDEDLDTLLKEAKAVAEPHNSKARDEELDTLLKEPKGVPEPDTSKATDEELDTLLKEAKAIAKSGEELNNLLKKSKPAAERDKSKTRNKEFDTLLNEAIAFAEPDKSKVKNEELNTLLKEANGIPEPEKTKARGEELDICLKEAKAVAKPDKTKVTKEELDTFLKEAKGVPEREKSMVTDEELDTLLKKAKAVGEPERFKVKNGEFNEFLEQTKNIGESVKLGRNTKEIVFDSQTEFKPEYKSTRKKEKLLIFEEKGVRVRSPMMKRSTQKKYIRLNTTYETETSFSTNSEKSSTALDTISESVENGSLEYSGRILRSSFLTQSIQEDNEHESKDDEQLLAVGNNDRINLLCMKRSDLKSRCLSKEIALCRAHEIITEENVNLNKENRTRDPNTQIPLRSFSVQTENKIDFNDVDVICEKNIEAVIGNSTDKTLEYEKGKAEELQNIESSIEDRLTSTESIEYSVEDSLTSAASILCARVDRDALKDARDATGCNALEDEILQSTSSAGSSSTKISQICTNDEEILRSVTGNLCAVALRNSIAEVSRNKRVVNGWALDDLLTDRTDEYDNKLNPILEPNIENIRDEPSRESIRDKLEEDAESQSNVHATITNEESGNRLKYKDEFILQSREMLMQIANRLNNLERSYRNANKGYIREGYIRESDTDESEVDETDG